MAWIAQYSSLPAVAVFASILLVPAAAMAQETGADTSRTATRRKRSTLTSRSGSSSSAAARTLVR